MVVNIRQRPTRLLRRGREASKEAGDPEADAALVGVCHAGKGGQHRNRQAGTCIFEKGVESSIERFVRHLLLAMP